MPAKKKPAPPMAVKRPIDPKKLDWKFIALTLQKDVKFAIDNMVFVGGNGMICDPKTGVSRHWKDRFADHYEMIPGQKIDRELMHAASLPRSKRLKFFRARDKKNHNTSKQCANTPPHPGK